MIDEFEDYMYMGEEYGTQNADALRCSMCDSLIPEGMPYYSVFGRAICNECMADMVRYA